MSQNEYILDDGDKVAVIGGGPSGSFFSIFAQKMAGMLAKDVEFTIFEPKDFLKKGPPGCNRCGGVISELLVQNLALEGIMLPDEIIRKGVNSYMLHTPVGSVSIETPSLERSIATVSRGAGPKGIDAHDKESFDSFLLQQAVDLGATLRTIKVDEIKLRNGKPVLYSGGEELMEADLLVGAFGLSPASGRMLEQVGFGYQRPHSITASIAELQFEDGMVEEYFGSSINLFLLPERGLKFAAIIPKGDYATFCVLGKDVGKSTLEDLLQMPAIKKVMPQSGYKITCKCLPQMSTSAPKVPFANRMVVCGDSGSTRLFKDGLGAAYFMGKSVAKTAIIDGVSEGNFREGYMDAYRELAYDNNYGRCLYAVTDIIRQNRALTKGMLRTVRKEQEREPSARVLSSILWDMFTGNERYRNVFYRSLDMGMIGDLIMGTLKP